MMIQHSRQPSFASSVVSTSARSRNTNSMISPKKRNPVKIGPWKLGKTLGKGANGRVFLATNVDTNQKAAVKIVSKSSLSNDPNQTQNTEDLQYENGTSQHEQEQDYDSAGLSYGIEREIIIMKLLNHKNVLRLYDVWETEKALYLVLEYVEGGELFDLLVDSGPLPEDTAVGFFSQIILGALYCHSLGICHRDLKPENILLDKDLNVKIADFGMAALESGRLLETSCGSPHYAAPEIISGLQYHGAESDVWSCGVILFALLTGRLPFDDDNIRDLLLKVQVGKFEIVEPLSPEAIDLINKMLTVDPEERIKTKDILKHPFVKKYYNCENDADFMQLPSPEAAISPVKSKDEIDQRILENLVILWHGRSADSIVEQLLSPTSNPEKIFYSLLLRYRHDHLNNKTTNSSNSLDSSNTTNNQQKINNIKIDADDLVRTSSIISKTTEKIAHSSPSSSNPNSTPRKRLSYTASTATNRPISFSNKRNTRSRDSLTFSKMTPPSSNDSSPSKNGSKHLDQQQQQDRFSLTPSKSFNIDLKRRSLIAIDTTPTKRSSKIINETSNLQKMLASRPSNTKLKRNSVTSKVLSSYAKLSEYENSKKNVEDYGKRASSDFAALCDMLFNDESKSNVKIPDSESMATINAIVFGNKKNRNSKRLSTNMASYHPSNSIRPATSNAIKSALKENNKYSKKLRNSSNPAERITQLLNANDFEDNERRTASDSHTQIKSNLVEPPKPISRLDPRYKAYETYQKRTSQHTAHLLKMQEEAEAEAKAAAEIKKREEELRIEQEKLELLKKQKYKGAELVDKTYDNHGLGLSSGTVLKKNEDYFNPPKPSQLKSNRYSNLSMYSTKTSSKRLSFYLKELDEEIAKNKTISKKDRLSRMSMIMNEPENILEEEDRTSELNVINHSNSMNTLNEDDEDNTEETEIDIHEEDDDFIGKPRSASISKMVDNELCFVDPNQKATTQPLITEKKHIGNNNNEYLAESSNITNGSSVYSPVPAIPPKIEDSFNNDSTADNAIEVPIVPGSPVKRQVKAKRSDGTFEVFEDAIRKSKQEFEEVPSKKSIVSVVEAPSQPVLPAEAPKPLNIEKQRQPLNESNETKNTARKSSIFSKLSQQIQPATPITERKSSFGKTLKSLFGSNSLASPETYHTILSTEDSFEALKSLLSGWSHYGIGNLVIDSGRNVLKGEIAKNNSLNVKSCKFTCVVSNSPNGSKITFNHEKGSAKSFSRLVGEVRRILINENVLVR